MGEKIIALSEDFMPQNYAYSAITHENPGGGGSIFVHKDE